MQNRVRSDVMYTEESLNESVRMKSPILCLLNKQVLNTPYENHTYTSQQKNLLELDELQTISFDWK